MITIRAGSYGYYVDEPKWDCDSLGNPVVSETDLPSHYFIYLRFNQPGVFCPLQTHWAEMTVEDYSGQKFKINCGSDNRILNIHPVNKPKHVTVQLVLPETHGFWFFVNSLKIDHQDRLKTDLKK